jgi:hypothetical protein
MSRSECYAVLRKYNMRSFRLNFIHYMYLPVLLQYNADVTGGVQ